MLARVLTRDQAVSIALEFRAARAISLKDSEAFDEIIFAIERLGAFLTRSKGNLGKFETAITEIAHDSVLAAKASQANPILHLSFAALYDSVRAGRNDAFHEGAVARQLANHAQELALVIEDALMSRAKAAAEFMVRDPVCAEPWHPLSTIRRTMLLNAFSFLPYGVKGANKWRLISDAGIATFLNSSSKSERDTRLLLTLDEALKMGLKDTKPMFCSPDTTITELASKATFVPYLVLAGKDRLCGIVTAFDLL